jgi:hypothetical protein
METGRVYYKEELNVYTSLRVFQLLFACLLARSMPPGFPGTGHLYTQVSQFQFIKIQPLALKLNIIKCSVKIMRFSTNEELKFHGLYFQLLLSPF